MHDRVHMPSLGGVTEWLDSEPLGPAELRGYQVQVNITEQLREEEIPMVEVGAYTTRSFFSGED